MENIIREYKKSETGIHILIFETKKSLYSQAMTSLFKSLSSREYTNVGLATGKTYERFYDILSNYSIKNKFSFSKISSFNLDEYVGIPNDDTCSYHYFMRNHLFSKIDLKESFIPDGNSEDLKKSAMAYEHQIASHGGIDIQYLGLGINGHIGFNEPGTPFDSRTHIAELAESTIRENSVYFDGNQVPKKAITMGIGTILDAKRIVLIATGESKSKIVKQTLDGSIEEKIPATALRLHQDATLLLDRDAGSLII